MLPALAAVVFAIPAIYFELDSGTEEASAVAYLAVVVAGLALAARRWSPAAVLAVVAAARVVVTIDTGNDFALGPALAVAMYTVGRRGDRRRAAWVAGLGAVVSSVPMALLDDENFILELIQDSAQFVLAAVVGDAARARADRFTEMIETEATARVQAERLRIARDLHDVVAHGLSTIAVQSGVAAHLIDRDPIGTRASLDIINKTGKESLEELRAMVGVLRSTDDAPLSPAPTAPDAFDEMLARARSSGLTIADESSGEFPPDVGDGLVVAVHRIVQEALTNVVRHAGPVAALVAVQGGAHSVSISVRNEPAAGPRSGGPATPSTGVGIVGMRERAESLGGWLQAESSVDGGFLVTAEIPYRELAS